MLEGGKEIVKACRKFLRLQLCILDPLGKVLGVFGMSMVWLTLLAGPNEPFLETRDILLTGVACICLGVGCWLAGRNRSEEFKPRHASLMVIILWFLLPLIGAVPLLPHTDGSITDAYFEAVSGLTASGATILTDIEDLPISIKLWRGMMTWMGGMGLIVLAVAILPSIGVGGRQMMKSEITGPLKEHDLTPQINETAKGLWLVYAILTGLCAVCYMIAGMSLFDAVIHSFTTMGLGGFSNYDASYGHFDSVAIEAVAVFFMLVAGMNFATHFSSLQAVAQGRQAQARPARPGRERKHPGKGKGNRKGRLRPDPLRHRGCPLPGRADHIGAHSRGLIALSWKPRLGEPRSATACSTRCRLRPRQGTQTPTTIFNGRWRSAFSSSCSPTSPPAADQPAAASR